MYKKLLIAGGIFLAPLAMHAATLSVSPSSGTFQTGNTITVDIQVNTQGSPIDGVDVLYLNYNPALLQAVDENTSVSGVQISAGTLMPVTPLNNVDTAAGRISFSQVTSGGSTYTNSTAQTLATVRFNVLAAGTASLNFNFTAGSTSDSNVASAGADLLTTVTNGSLTLNAPADTTPPAISNIAASSIIQTGATITWTTDEASDTQVEYGLTTSYGNSTALNTSMVTSHSAALSGLSAGTTYNYRVKSRDAAGNLATSLNRTFNTTPAPDTTPPNAITNLASSNVQQNSLTLTWSAPADPPSNGAAASYDIRYSTSPITQANFASATQVTGEPSPATPGTSQSYILAGLTAGTAYSIAIVSTDAANNTSLISNVISATTQALPDTTPPTVSITSPTTGATVSSTITITANASDNVAIAGVQFKVDGVNVGAEDTTSPYSTSWNTTSVADGSHTITAVARDAAGNTTTSNVVTVSVLNTPPPPFNFSLSTGGDKTVTQGSSITNTITATLVSGTAQAVTFSSSGVPVGATASFAPTQCSPGCSTILTIDTIATAAPGSSTITVTGTDGSLTRTATFILTINPSPSTKFVIGDNVQVQISTGLNVYATPSTSGSLLGTQVQGALGVVTGGPTFADGAHWWQINYDNTPDGWSVEDNLGKVVFVSNLLFTPSVEGTSNVAGKNFAISIVNPSNQQVAGQFTAAPNTGGQIPLPTSISNLVPGTYDVFVSASRYLRRKHTGTVIASNTTISLQALFAGDFNDDGIVNSLDWSLMNVSWFTADPITDINEDSLVNTIDFSWFNKNYNKISD